MPYSMEMLKSPSSVIHLDLFSGIGGFALAVDTVWEDAEHIFCDNNEFCQQVLKKHWPNSQIFPDIRGLTFDALSDSYRGREDEVREAQKVQRIGGKALDGREFGRTVEILTGGFPCQPFSQAGRRKGTDDDRFLWPEMLRVIQEFKPRWVVGENVAGLLTIEQGMVFEQVCADLEAEGYEVQSFVIPACAVNAPHRRDRVWIVANRQSWRKRVGKQKRGRARQSKEKVGDRNSNASSSISAGERSAYGGKIGKSKRKRQKQSISQGSEVWSNSANGNTQRWDWNANWIEVATALCRMDDGVSHWVDERGRVRNSRNNRLKALGNAIVPAVAVEIFKAIKAIDDAEWGRSIPSGS